ncbi:MAG TPA: DUF2330 domain-containing protein [Kofleriaceae bacterium]|nr:DUF2330 domain-containing protein [Kofleriaceae bacterium]
MSAARLAAALASLLCAASLPAERRAEACGGCFGQTITTVESHRMAVLLSAERSVLWDQIAYSGAPEDFVWVLPVPGPEVTIDLADASFFDELDGQTAPVVQPRPAEFDQEGCFGCCAAGGADTAAAGGDEDVIVYTEGAVGPYETVVLGGEDGAALQDWLVDHGYPVQEAVVPIIDKYVDEGSAFVVLRLAPDAGVQAMQPVRVGYKGFLARFPLEMVKIGAYGQLGLTLWIIADQRYEPMNYPTARIDPAQLVYDWNTITSNYEDVFRDTIDAAGGRAWIVEHADRFDLLWFTLPTDPDLVRQTVRNAFVTRLRTRMLVEHMDQDIELVPAEDAQVVSRFLQAGSEIDRPFADEEDEDDGCRVQQHASVHVALLLFVLASLAWMWRPRRSRRARAR